MFSEGFVLAEMLEAAYCVEESKIILSNKRQYWALNSELTKAENTTTVSYQQAAYVVSFKEKIRQILMKMYQI